MGQILYGVKCRRCGKCSDGAAGHDARLGSRSNHLIPALDAGGWKPIKVAAQPAFSFRSGGCARLVVVNALKMSLTSEVRSLEEPAELTVPTWDEIVRDHSPRVYRLAYRLTGNRQDAEDLAQETFVRVFRSLHTFTPGTIGGWLHRITTNLFLDQARRKSKIRFDGLTEDAEAKIPGTAPGPERSFEYNNLDLDVQAALDALAPDFRAAVVLCDLEGLSYEEVAEALNVKLGTVRSRIHRGRGMLREKLPHRNPAVRAPATMSLPKIRRTIPGVR